MYIIQESSVKDDGILYISKKDISYKISLLVFLCRDLGDKEIVPYLLP